MSIFAVDTGKAQTKWFTGDKQGKFTSAIAHQAEIICNDIENGAKSFTINGQTRVVAEDALKSGVQQEYNLEISGLLEDIPFLVAHAAEEAGVDLAKVETFALGLPIIGFKENKAKLIEIMSNLNINGIQYNHEINVQPQGCGALFAYRHESAVTREDDEGLLIDLGGNTAIVVSHKGYNVIREFTKQYDKRGISAAAKQLSGVLTEKTNKQYSVIKILEIMNNGFVKHFGERINVRKEIDEVLSNHVETLVKTIQTEFGEIIAGKDHILLAGGGAILLKKHFPAEWTGMVTIVNEPEWANVRGFYYTARRGES